MPSVAIEEKCATCSHFLPIADMREDLRTMGKYGYNGCCTRPNLWYGIAWLTPKLGPCGYYAQVPWAIVEAMEAEGRLDELTLQRVASPDVNDSQ